MMFVGQGGFSASIDLLSTDNVKRMTIHCTLHVFARLHVLCTLLSKHFASLDMILGVVRSSIHTIHVCM